MNNISHFQDSEKAKRDVGILCTENGVSMQGVTVVSSRRGGDTGVKRSTIKGWSSASRRRMREFLVTHTIPDGYKYAQITVTIPGLPLPPDDVQKLRHRFFQDLARLKICAVWRQEQQERGQIHYHLVAGVPANVSDADWEVKIRDTWLKCLSNLGGKNSSLWLPFAGNKFFSEPWTISPDVFADYDLIGLSPDINGKEYEDDKSLVWVALKWLDMSYESGEAKKPQKYMLADTGVIKRLRKSGKGSVLVGKIAVKEVSGRRVAYISEADYCELTRTEIRQCPGIFTGVFIRRWPDLAAWPGAYKYACDVTFHQDTANNQGWFRYLNNDVSKSKQAQISQYENMRHWGKINCKWFQPLEKDLQILTRQQYVAVVRWFRRLRTPVIKCPKAPQGRKLGYAAGGSSMIGKSYWFSDQATVKRMIDQARKLYE